MDVMLRDTVAGLYFLWYKERLIQQLQAVVKADHNKAVFHLN